jgi:hypothetical protein
MAGLCGIRETTGGRAPVSKTQWAVQTIRKITGNAIDFFFERQAGSGARALSQLLTLTRGGKWSRDHPESGHPPRQLIRTPFRSLPRSPAYSGLTRVRRTSTL